MDLRIAGTVNDSIVDGPGIRFTVFTQGCPHHCPGCHNPQTHDFNGGMITDTAVIIDKILENPLLDGVTFSGGEPFCQCEPLCEIAEKVKKAGLDIVTFTGFTFEQLTEQSDDVNMYAKLLGYTDILIDGRFIEAEKSLDASFRGSLNQRIIDCQKSLETGRVIERTDLY